MTNTTLPELSNCVALLAENRWGDTVTCPDCKGVIIHTSDDTDTGYPRHRCANCQRTFDVLSDSVLADCNFTIPEAVYALTSPTLSFDEIATNINKSVGQVGEFFERLKPAFNDSGVFDLAELNNVESRKTALYRATYPAVQDPSQHSNFRDPYADYTGRQWGKIPNEQLERYETRRDESISPLIETDINYIRTGTVPGKYNSGDLEDRIERRMDNYLERLAYWFQDFILFAEYCDKHGVDLQEKLQTNANLPELEQFTENPVHSTEYENQFYRVLFNMGHLVRWLLDQDTTAKPDVNAKLTTVGLVDGLLGKPIKNIEQERESINQVNEWLDANLERREREQRSRNKVNRSVPKSNIEQIRRAIQDYGFSNDEIDTPRLVRMIGKVGLGPRSEFQKNLDALLEPLAQTGEPAQYRQLHQALTMDIKIIQHGNKPLRAPVEKVLAAIAPHLEPETIENDSKSIAAICHDSSRSRVSDVCNRLSDNRTGDTYTNYNVVHGDPHGWSLTAYGKLLVTCLCADDLPPDRIAGLLFIDWFVSYISEQLVNDAVNEDAIAGGPEIKREFKEYLLSDVHSLIAPMYKISENFERYGSEDDFDDSVNISSFDFIAQDLCPEEARLIQYILTKFNNFIEGEYELDSYFYLLLIVTDILHSYDLQNPIVTAHQAVAELENGEC